jgi:hypothetical protein
MLSGKARPDWIYAIAIGAMAGTTGYRFVFAGRDIASNETIGKGCTGK